MKKPYNPVLGEIFRCRHEYEDGTRAYYVAEQTSHHPPISSYFFDSPQNCLSIQGEIKPKSRFLGNSAATLMNGESRLVFTNLNEEYVITLPNVYARGILFGTMILELGDCVSVRCENTKITCDLEFRTKGFFTGTYNAIRGKIKNGKHTIAEISGKWSDVSYIKFKDEEQKELFNADSKIYQKIVDESNQEEKESRRLWSNVSSAILKKDMDLATLEKTKIEDDQRKERNEKKQFEPRFFTATSPECFEFKKQLSLDKTKRENELEEFIFQ